MIPPIPTHSKGLPACHQNSPRHAAYVARVEELEAEGCDTSDAQGIADMEFATIDTGGHS